MLCKSLCSVLLKIGDILLHFRCLTGTVPVPVKKSTGTLTCPGPVVWLIRNYWTRLGDGLS